ncbi:hypothetical protein BGLA2_1080011 [Burkholderia gladioli]|uniref:ead/Ea22-like family protein n=1 Tax=Burkholderia gladioli TaxID=28095 RepID=UPI001CADB560|nr:ead/Ea22-like family protein [Burkholderia gladioli]CAG9193304.1 hypothetical protein BGLA2_1080011 [Burkholderia gladioli]
MENITSDYDALQAAAEKATKGNWINVGAWVENERHDLKDICDCRPNGNEDYEQAVLDAAYIALANPNTILRLLFERRATSAINLSCGLRPAAANAISDYWPATERVALTDGERDALIEAICWANDDGLPGTAEQLRSILYRVSRAAQNGEATP